MFDGCATAVAYDAMQSYLRDVLAEQSRNKHEQRRT